MPAVEREQTSAGAIWSNKKNFFYIHFPGSTSEDLVYPALKTDLPGPKASRPHLRPTAQAQPTGMGNFHSLEQGQGKLSKTELDRLERRLRKLGRGRTELARSDLIGVEGMDNPFIDRMFGMFDKGAHGLALGGFLFPAPT